MIDRVLVGLYDFNVCRFSFLSRESASCFGVLKPSEGVANNAFMGFHVNRKGWCGSSIVDLEEDSLR